MTTPTRSSLIIGSTAVVGDAIAQQLATLGRVSTAGRRNADLTFDLAAPDVSVAAGQSVDVAVLVAADFGGTSIDDMVRATQVNVVGALASCALAFAAGAEHIVLISTLSATYSPDDPYFGIYALSKRQGEEVVTLFCRQHKLPLTVLRPTALYDAAARCRAHQGLFYGIIDRARSGTDFTIAGSADPFRNYLHLDDFARVVRRVVETRHTGTFACAHSESRRISEIASLAFEVFGRGGRVEFDRTKGDIAATPPVPSSDIYDALSIWPMTSLGEGIRQIRDHADAQGAT